MYTEKGKANDVKITYIGGGSRGWAWSLMGDLASEHSLTGTVTLYDIDQVAAAKNVLIGNIVRDINQSGFSYVQCNDLQQSLVGADFVIISILPGTFDEMQSDVHAPESYGIYQSVGDTTGPGGVLRALRTLPMYEKIASAIKMVAPQAWVINYTNPMGLCVRMLYETFPGIKAFGCCHEVFGAQDLLAHLAQMELGVEEIDREDISITVQGLNHFTWLSQASYQGIDLFPIYEHAAERYAIEGLQLSKDKNWMNNHFASSNRVKFDLFRQFGQIAAAGDRHLAEFCPGWYLKNPVNAFEWKYALTPVSWRKENLTRLLAQSERIASRLEVPEITSSGEEGVRQMKALIGLGNFVTNINLPNTGQIPNIAIGTVVETNANLSQAGIDPVSAGKMDGGPLVLSQPHIYQQERLISSWRERSLKPAFQAFLVDPMVRIPRDEAKQLFDNMVFNTREYLKEYYA